MDNVLWKFGNYFLFGGFFALLLVNLVGAFFFGMNTGHWRPMVDLTIGKLLSSDEESFQLLTAALNSPELATISPILRETQLAAIKQTVITNLILAIVVIYLIFKLYSFFLGQQQYNNFTVVAVAMILALVSYAIIGVLYAAWTLNDKDMASEITGSMAMRFIPFKGAILAAKNIPFLLNLDENVFLNTPTDNSIVGRIVNSSGV